MSREVYIKRNFRGDTLAMINQANAIIAEYQSAGFKLTLRQLYYQFVARDLIENTPENYKLLSRTMVYRAWQSELTMLRWDKRFLTGWDLADKVPESVTHVAMWTFAEPATWATTTHQASR